MHGPDRLVLEEDNQGRSVLLEGMAVHDARYDMGDDPCSRQIAATRKVPSHYRRMLLTVIRAGQTVDSKALDRKCL